MSYFFIKSSYFLLFLSSIEILGWSIVKSIFSFDPDLGEIKIKEIMIGKIKIMERNSNYKRPS